MGKKGLDSIRRAPKHAWAGGVCAGLAYWCGVPMWMVRVAWVLGSIPVLPAAIVLYAVVWVFMPAWSIEPLDFDRRVGLTEPGSE